MENNMIINYVVEDVEKNLKVKKSIPYYSRTGIAQAIARETIDEDGEYKPWKRSILLKLNILAFYTDFAIPEDWTDNQLDSFCREIGWAKIEEYLGAELEEVNLWIDELVEYRKDVYKPGKMNRVLNQISGMIKELENILEANPALAYSIEDLLKQVFMIENDLGLELM